MPVVSNHMSTDLLTVEPNVRLAEAARRMAQRGVGAVLMLEGERLAGILTERDLLKAVAKPVTGRARVSEWMTRQPETVEPDETTDQAASLMIHGGFRHLPVVEGGRPIGNSPPIRDLMRVALQDSAPAASRRLFCELSQPASAIKEDGPSDVGGTRPSKKVRRLSVGSTLIADVPKPATLARLCASSRSRSRRPTRTSPGAIRSSRWARTACSASMWVDDDARRPDRQADSGGGEIAFFLPYVSRAAYLGSWGWITAAIADEELLEAGLEWLERAIGSRRRST